MEFLEREGYIEDAGPYVNVARRQVYRITPKGKAWIED
jgi:DNA-binding PadR family transcriptional regulator